MTHKTLLRSLHEMAASNVAFSSEVLGHTQAAIKGVENEETAKIDRARGLMKSLITSEDFDRQEILERLMTSLNITLSTATSYFQRIAKEMGLTNLHDDKEKSGGMVAGDDTPPMNPDNKQPVDELPDEELELDDEVPASNNPDRQGVIRVIPGAHLIYKRQNEEGTYDELWIYNVGKAMKDELEIRRDILAGTDIPPRRQKSKDGTQSYRLSTMGNAQIMEITGLVQ